MKHSEVVCSIKFIGSIVAVCQKKITYIQEFSFSGAFANYGPIQEGDIWRIINNKAFNSSINGKDIVKCIKAQRIRWLGHVEKMEVGAMTRKMMERKLFIGRRKGRPRLRWINDVVADLKVMKIKQWVEKMKDREKWRLIVKEAKAHSEL